MGTTDSVAIPSTTNADRGVTFTQFAKQVRYTIPDGCNVSGASVKDTEALLVFAGEQGNGYIWNSKKRKFYKTEVNRGT